MAIRDLSPAKRKKTLERTLKAFVLFCRQNFGIDPYDYQIRIARACLSSVIVEPKDVFIKLARQSGKTETVTLLLRFLIIFFRLMTDDPLMAGVASPKGEQAKTDVDRIKKSIPDLRERWHVEDKEWNAHTVRAYRLGELHAEIFRFSLAPTTTNESKTLNVLIVEEAHKVDDQRRSDQLDPMLSSTGGVTWMIGVGTTLTCDFKRGCDGELPDSVPVVVDVDDVIADRRKKYGETGDPKHLEYEKAFQRELRKKGRENPEIKRNYYLEDTVEEGNFVSRERFLSCGRPASQKIPVKKLFLGGDWARRSDHTWFVLGNDENDVVDMLKIPHLPYAEQIALLNEWLREERTDFDGETFTYEERIRGVCGDSTGQGDMPMETLESDTRLPIGEESHVKFTLQSKHQMYTLLQDGIFKDPDDPLRFSYPADHPLASEFEEQFCGLVKEYKGDGEYLSVHHSDDPAAKDDAPDATALMCMAASEGEIGELLIL